MRLVSLQSGTSADGIDAAVVDARSTGSRVELEPVRFATFPWPEPLRRRILAASTDAATTVAEVTQLHALLGREFGAAAVAAAAGSPVDLVVSHGQTVYHWVENGMAGGTLQLGEPAWIAEAVQAPVLANVRSADIAAGGQGAPLMGLFDSLWLGPVAQEAGRSMGTVNLGGIANVSVVDADGSSRAWDTGPANSLLDAVVAHGSAGARTYDADGALAFAGTVDTGLLEQLLQHPYFSLAPPKSTGRETFSLHWVESVLRETGAAPSLPDLAATLTELTAQSLARSLASGCGAELPEELVASGGGVRNPALMGALRRHLDQMGVRLTDSRERGVDPQAKEALLFALIGFLSWHGVPAALPPITGSRGARVLGQFVPGPRPLRLPDPLPAVTALTVTGRATL